MMGQKAVDLWNEVIASEEEGEERQRQVSKVEAVYQRRKPDKKSTEGTANLNRVSSVEGNRVSFIAGPKRVSWSRSLSTRGRTSIALVAYVKNQPQHKQPRRKKPPVPKGKQLRPPNLQKEKEYFDEVDAFELLEESPSPKNFGTWTMGNQTNPELPYLSSRLEKWLISKKLNRSCGPSSTLSKILEASATHLEPICDDALDSLGLKTPEKTSARDSSALQPVQRCDDSLTEKDILDRKIKMEPNDLEDDLKRLSLASEVTSSHREFEDSFAELLAVCGQMCPLKFKEVFSKLCELESITKIGEGTFGEAFMAGNFVCKIVPIDGDLKINGESQKRSEELLEEVILSQTLNKLRERGADAYNSCSAFIETKGLKVCQGPYDPMLIRAWEDWDAKNGSENDHPDFPEKQCYVMFVLEHGGKDLESFVLLNFDEARSLLIQVTAGLAVAEAAYEFEHRDLHWGNILLSRNDSVTYPFVLEGRKLFIRTFGLQISIIDFTLSRINTDEKILFLDLSSDPYLFKGPKGDKQSETYRKMKAVTEDYWEGSFPRTNVLWLIYLVDTLLIKKSFDRSSKDERELRSMKKRLEKYQSAKEAIADAFFADMLVDQTS